MASLDTLIPFTAADGFPTTTATSAVYKTVNGKPVWSFSNSAASYLDFEAIMPSNFAATTGITLECSWFADSGTSTNVLVWNAATEDQSAAAANAFNTDAFQAAIASSTSAGIGTLTVPQVTIWSLTNSQIANIVKGRPFRIRLGRPTGGSDNLAVAVDVFALHVKET